MLYRYKYFTNPKVCCLNSKGLTARVNARQNKDNKFLKT